MRFHGTTLAGTVALALINGDTSAALAAQNATLPLAVSTVEQVKTPESILDWQAMTLRDVRAYAEAARRNYIYAAYPKPAAWAAWFGRALADVESKVPLVRDARGYQAVLRYFGTVFHDAHAGIRFTMPSIEIAWPGFLVRFDNGHYRVTGSRVANVVDGTELTGCDGKPVSDWIETIAKYEVTTPINLENSRMTAALRLLADWGSPLRPRPSRCVIGGREISLEWRDVPFDDLQAINLSWQGNRKRGVTTRAVGTDGAWVTFGHFIPESADQATAFHEAIATAPSLRDKRFIVIDVRGNGGDSYDWFMGYLRGLYGQPVADHYATARLRIRGVFRLSPAYLALDKGGVEEADAFKTPVDENFEVNKDVDDMGMKRAKEAGAPIYRMTPIPIPRTPAPANPVHAKVYVLTDYGCNSSCIAFVDEMKLFPGVMQIGLPTNVDSRSGTAVEIPLPSGNAISFFASMTRDGRLRGDNVSQIPSIRFPGDIRNDEAVERWVLQDVVR